MIRRITRGWPEWCCAEADRWAERKGLSEILRDRQNGYIGTGMTTNRSYDEIIDFLAAGTTPDSLLAFRPSQRTTERVQDLVEKTKQGTISSDEQSELDDYLQLEHLLILAKARAREHTRP